MINRRADRRVSACGTFQAQTRRCRPHCRGQRAQFETVDGTVRVRPALVQFLTILRDVDPWTVAMVAATPAADELDGLSPTEWARQGRDVDTLFDFAHQLCTEWT